VEIIRYSFVMWKSLDKVLLCRNH